MDEKVKVDVLLKEYETLSSYALQRNSQRFALLSVSGGLGSYAFFSAHAFDTYQRAILMVTAVALLLLWWQLGGMMVRCANRMAEIEERVNSVAREGLMQWESKRLGSTVIFWLYPGRRRRQSRVAERGIVPVPLRIGRPIRRFERTR